MIGLSDAALVYVKPKRKRQVYSEQDVAKCTAWAEGLRFRTLFSKSDMSTACEVPKNALEEALRRLMKTQRIEDVGEGVKRYRKRV